METFVTCRLLQMRGNTAVMKDALAKGEFTQTE